MLRTVRFCLWSLISNACKRRGSYEVSPSPDSKSFFGIPLRNLAKDQIASHAESAGLFSSLDPSAKDKSASSVFVAESLLVEAS